MNTSPLKLSLCTASTLACSISMGPAQELPEAAKKSIAKMVEAQDADKDGKVTGQELFLFALGRTPDPEKANKQQIGQSIHWELTRIDADRDGAITAEEIGADAIATAVHKKPIRPSARSRSNMRPASARSWRRSSSPSWRAARW